MIRESDNVISTPPRGRRLTSMTLRRRLVLWFARRFDLPHCHMMSTWRTGEWLFIDVYGAVWLLMRTDDPSVPFQIICARKP